MRWLAGILVGALLPAGAAAQNRPSAAAMIDTVLRFDVRERTWTWPYFSAHVGIGCQGSALAIGTTTAPDSAVMDRTHYCAGALVELRNTTLMLRNARGQVHLRVNRIGLRAAGDSTTQPRR